MVMFAVEIKGKIRHQVNARLHTGTKAAHCTDFRHKP
jgi:hypothetical protein